MAIEMGLKFRDSSKRRGRGEDLLYGEKVGVVAAVLEDGEKEGFGLGEGDELVCFGRGGHEGLFHDHCSIRSVSDRKLFEVLGRTMFPMLQTQLGQLKVARRTCPYYDKIDVFILDDFFNRSVAFDSRPVLLSIVVSCGLALDYGVEFEVFGYRLNEGDLEDFGGEAVANYGYIVLL